jgi:enoyl-[acyl-carrier protein] reductase II
MRVIRNAWVDDWERRAGEIRPFPEQMAVSARAGAFAAMGIGGEVDLGRAAMPCGQGAGAIHDVRSCAEIVRDVVAEAEATIARLGALGAEVR